MKRFSLMVIVLAALIFAGSIGNLRAADESPAAKSAKPAPRMMCQDNFDKMDANHDGMVTKEEFMAVGHPGYRPEEVFKSKDANGDGSLTKDEFCAGRGMGKGMGPGACRGATGR